jgi:hypothetical protein
MSYVKTVAGPGIPGFHPTETIITIKNTEASTAFAAGDVVWLNFAAAATTAANQPGLESSGFVAAKMVVAQAAANISRRAGIFVVCQEPIAVGALGKAMLTGITNINTSATADKGDFVVAPNPGAKLAVPANATAGINVKALGVILSTPTGTACTALFDGLHGLGFDGN